MSNPISETLKGILSQSKMDKAIAHEGVSILDGAPGRGSGRYPLGSGKVPLQHNSGDLLDRIEVLHNKGLSDAEIARELDILGPSGTPSSARVRALKSILKTERRSTEFAKATKLRDEGMSYQQIAKELGYKNESSVRNLLDEDAMRRKEAAYNTALYLKEYADKHGMVDVGKGAEQFCGTSYLKMREATMILEEAGYHVYNGRVPQVTNKGQFTTQSVLCAPGVEHKEIYNFDKVFNLADADKTLVNDGQDIRRKAEPPASLDSKRVSVVYGDEGGTAKDGLVEIRPGVKDVNIGDHNYAQVRIMVDGSHYIKGMAIYSDDLPDGIDVRFNTNKASGTPMCGKDKNNSVFKPISKEDPNNPFGALLREEGGQTYYDDPNGKYTNSETGQKQSLNKVNITRFEGDWKEWADTLPSQFLAKQPIELAKRQLKMAIDDKKGEYEDIMANANPTVKRKLLNEFADSCDSAAVKLKAASLPRQKYQVILPIDSLKDDECYAPNYKDGEYLALIRYPHASVTEIPIVKVNNKNAEGKRIITNTGMDAIGINANVASRLSGADFDGDTVQAIPTKNGYTNILSKPQYDALKGWDPKDAYRYRPGMKVMKDTQKQMGVISNLIMDMTLQGASEDEFVRAIKHSMCVIDAEKHKLDWKRSEVENDIEGLKKTYQKKEGGKGYGGAATLITRAKGEYDVDKRKGSPTVNIKGGYNYDPDRPEGALLWKTATGKDLYYEKNGKTQKRVTKSTRMAETDDATTLISDANTSMEKLYASYANTMKGMANKARLDMVTTPKLEYNPQAAKTYATEVNSLKEKFNASEKNQVRERAAQRVANTRANVQRENLYKAGLTKKEVDKEMKKINQRELTAARVEKGAHRVAIEPTEREWAAIQAGAIHDTTLAKMLKYIKDEDIYKYTNPNATKGLSQWKINKIQSMKSSGYTLEQIANSLGVSTSTVSNYL